MGGFEINQVFSVSLPSKKRWYALSTALCGCKPRIFAGNKVFSYFPSEIAKTKIEGLWRENGETPASTYFDPGREKDEVYVATAFGICAGLLRQREFSRDSFVFSNNFQEVINAVNEIDLRGFEADDDVVHNNNITPKTARIHKLESHLKSYQSKAAELFCTPPPTPRLRSQTYQDINLVEIAEDPSIGPTVKKRIIAKQCNEIIINLKEFLNPNTLGSILGYGALYDVKDAKIFSEEQFSKAFLITSTKYKEKECLIQLLGEDVLRKQAMATRVPDWVQLLVKLKTKLPDDAWQTVLNYLNLGQSGKSDDAQLLLTKNMIKANKEVTFSVVKKAVGIEELPNGVIGFGTSLPEVIVWAIREARLHQCAKEEVVFNLKLDGRPLFGKDQVSVGIVPINYQHVSSESADAVYPLAIANCKENRTNLKALIKKLNKEKQVIKEHGIKVDGILYKIKFIVTLDYKALLLLMVKKCDEDFQLGGKGLDVEFCVYCNAIRACCHHLGGRFDETCLGCLQSKANIGNWNGLRDDLSFLLEEDLSNIQLCSLHQEMRNTEQLLGSLGLFANSIGCLERCNKALASFGPENTREFDRIQVRLQPGQTTEVSKANIKVSSMSGPTERQVLANVEPIIAASLPIDSVKTYYSQFDDTARKLLLTYIQFYESQKLYLEGILKKGQYLRDYGVKSELVELSETKVLKPFLDKKLEDVLERQSKIEETFLQCEQLAQNRGIAKQAKRRKRSNASNDNPSKEALATAAAHLQVEHFIKVFGGWREIAMIMRGKVFEEEEDENIDIYEVKCQLWGRLLRHMFGLTLGSGDYGHLTIDHSGMLFRLHRSFRLFSNQGFEASHKLHRMLYSRSTNHDRAKEAQSLEQILVHWFSEKLLELRYQFLKAKELIENGSRIFRYRGCGWSHGYPVNKWTIDDKLWISTMNDLFKATLGKDYLEYVYTKGKGTAVSELTDPRLQMTYSHEEWEETYESKKKEAKLSQPLVVNLLHLFPTSDCGDATEKDYDEHCDGDDNEEDEEESYNNDDDDYIDFPGGKHQDLDLCGDDGNNYICLSDDESFTEIDGKVGKVKKPAAAAISVESDSEDDEFKTSKEDFDQVNGSSHELSYQNIRPNLPSKGSDQLPISIPQNTASRVVQASTRIPVIGSQPTTHIRALFGNFSPTDPTKLLQRPCSSVLTTAENLMKKNNTNARKIPTGVQIGLFGSFNSRGLAVLRKFCKIADIQRCIVAEISWLDVANITDADKAKIGAQLWHQSPTTVILKHGQKAIDVESFSLLALERYIDNMVIDITIERFLKESYAAGKKDTLYLPSEFWQWVTCDHDFLYQKIESLFVQLDGQKLKQILAPVHMTNHWGLVYVDLEGKTLYFDDGLRLVPSQYVINGIKDVLEILKVMTPTHEELSLNFWSASAVDFQRFGMPSQTATTARNMGEGAGSCGIGVINSARDFIIYGPSICNCFSWSFAEMKSSRIQLMLKILSWSDL